MQTAGKRGTNGIAFPIVRSHRTDLEPPCNEPLRGARGEKTSVSYLTWSMRSLSYYHRIYRSTRRYRTTVRYLRTCAPAIDLPAWTRGQWWPGGPFCVLPFCRKKCSYYFMLIQVCYLCTNTEWRIVDLKTSSRLSFIYLELRLNHEVTQKFQRFCLILRYSIGQIHLVGENFPATSGWHCPRWRSCGIPKFWGQIPARWFNDSWSSWIATFFPPVWLQIYPS